jgi:RNA polymerase sigma factor for flagellar operon FliA
MSKGVLSPAQRELAARHRSLAVRVARIEHARSRCVPFDDLLGAAELGLSQAALSFDAGEGAAFETFAYFRVTGAVRDAVRHEARAFVLRRAAERAADAMAAEQDDEGDPLYDDARATTDQLDSRAAAIQGAFLAALAAATTAASPEDLAVESAGLVIVAHIVRETIATLPPRDRELVQSHYFAGVELKSLALRLGVSYTTARRQHQDALTRLGKRLKERGVAGGATG